MTRSIFGTLGLLALFVAIVVGMLATFGAFGKKASTGPLPESPRERTTAAHEVKQAKETAAAIGQTVAAGDVSWTVTDARQASEVHKLSFPPKTQPGNFVHLAFTAKNTSDGPVTLTADSMSLLGEDRQKYPAEAAVNSDYIEDEKNILFNERSLLKPGETKEGEVNIELPTGASASIVELGDADPTANEEKYVNLGL
jgi:hypothetical protein